LIINRLNKKNVSEIMQLFEKTRHFLRLERLPQKWNNGILEYWKIGF